MNQELVSAVVLLREGGSALLQHRDDKLGLRHAGMWVPPGGHQEPGESELACAKREFREETGYECGALDWLLSLDDSSQEGWPATLITFFWAQYDGTQQLQCMEGQALKFVERSAAAAYPIPPYLVRVWDMAIAASRQKGLT